MRDKITAEIAIKMANTGHLTLSTLHTNDAPSASVPVVQDGRGTIPDRQQYQHHRGTASDAKIMHTLQGKSAGE
jgi:hypothetical protein